MYCALFRNSQTGGSTLVKMGGHLFYGYILIIEGAAIRL